MGVFKDYCPGYFNSTVNRRHKLDQYSLHMKRGPLELVIIWPAAASIIYGQVVGDSELSGGSAETTWGMPVTGVFEWEDPSPGLAVDTYSLNVIFTPDDERRFVSQVGTVSLVVNKATPEISSWPTASSIDYGQQISDSSLSGGIADVDGSFAWVDDTPYPDAGSHDVEVIFTPTDTDNYQTVVDTVTLTVQKITPEITWPTANDLDYGLTLADVTYATSGSAEDAEGIPVLGNFGWVNPGVIPNHSINYTARFTPTDTTNYNMVDGNVYVRVMKLFAPGFATFSDGATSQFGDENVFIDSARVRWKGVNGTGTSTHYNDKTNYGTSYSGTSGNRSGSVTAPSLTSGRILVWCTIAAQMTQSSDQNGGSASIKIGGSTVASYSNWLLSSMGGQRNGSPGSTYSINWNRESGHTYSCDSAAQLREKYYTYYTTYTTDPKLKLGSLVLASLPGSISGGEITPWQNIYDLADDGNNIMTHDFSGSGKAQVEIEIAYYTTG